MAGARPGGSNGLHSQACLIVGSNACFDLELSMSIHTLTVEKEYRSAEERKSVVVYGWIDIEAENRSEAEDKFHALLCAGLQTTDPRIEWSEDEADYRNDDDGDWEYVDFSFGLSGDPELS